MAGGRGLPGVCGDGELLPLPLTGASPKMSASFSGSTVGAAAGGAAGKALGESGEGGRDCPSDEAAERVGDEGAAAGGAESGCSDFAFSPGLSPKFGSLVYARMPPARRARRGSFEEEPRDASA